jgi:hypothetical protein
MAKGHKRRVRGKASIVQRESDDVWVGTVSFGYDKNCTRTRKTVCGNTNSEVGEKILKMQS